MKLHYTIIGTLCCFLAVACNDFLEVTPKDMQTEGQLYATRGGFFSAVNGIYNDLGSSTLYGNNLSYGLIDVIGKRYLPNASNTYLTALAGWDFANAEVEASLTGIWAAAYENIYACNVLIANVDKQEGVLSDADAKLIKGEMLALRAFLHFDMLRLFGPIYYKDPEATAIPYNASEKVSLLEILPAKEVARRVLADLAQAEQLLSADPVIAQGPLTAPDTEKGDDTYLSYRQLRMNYYAVKALQARVHLYIEDKPAALAAAKALLNDPRVAEHFPFVDPAKLLANNSNPDRVFSTEVLMGLYNDKMANLHDFTFNPSNAGSALLKPRENFIDLSYGVFAEETEDYRFQTQWEISTAVGVSGHVFKKFRPITDPDKKYFWGRFMPLIRLSEMYYIAAECEPNPEDGLQWLKTIRAKRGVTREITAAALENTLMQEYYREFVGEGQIFYMLKRWVSKNGLGNYYNGYQATALKPADFDKCVLPLPAGELEYR